MTNDVIDPLFVILEGLYTSEAASLDKIAANAHVPQEKALEILTSETSRAFIGQNDTFFYVNDFNQLNIWLQKNRPRP